MRSSNSTFCTVKYVVTDDSAKTVNHSWVRTHIVEVAVSTLIIIGLAVVGLYFAGILEDYSAVQVVAEEDWEIVELAVAEDPLCMAYSLLTEDCSDISVDQIAEKGCMTFVEKTGGICVSYDRNDMMCIVNSQCKLVDSPELKVLKLDNGTDGLCESYSIVVDACAKVSVEEISENQCTSYVERTGKICVSYDENNTCVVNESCNVVNTSMV